MSDNFLKFVVNFVVFLFKCVCTFYICLILVQSKVYVCIQREYVLHVIVLIVLPCG